MHSSPFWLSFRDACLHASYAYALTRAVSQALCAQDYSLMLGMPGTGKSSTIVFLIRIIVLLGKR
jgi:hypothetical protein